MASRIGITPDWAEDLLSIWASADAGADRRKMGYASASPMFRLWGVVSDDVEEEGSYGTAEVLAMRAAIEKLQATRPELYQAILATFKPWAGIEATDTTRAQAIEAGAMLAKWVDDAVGG